MYQLNLYINDWETRYTRFYFRLYEKEQMSNSIEYKINMTPESIKQKSKHQAIKKKQLGGLNKFVY